MGSSRKKMKKTMDGCERLVSSDSVYEIAKKKKSNKTSKRKKKKKRSQYVTIELKDTRKFFCKEFKDMRKLSSNDEPFHLSWSQICKILAIIRSRKTPTPDIYVKWGEYAMSFYLKMCTCFGVDYQHLEATDCGNKLLLPETSLKEQEEHTECSGVNQLLTTNMSYEERLYQIEHEEVGYSLAIHTGPFEFGSYSSGKTPDYIPYHLYLLVKEAVDIMKRSEWHKNTNDLIDLTRVEAKIRFFCTYFHSHLPTDWEYRRDKAGSVVAGYDTMRQPRYDMAGYTPIGDRVEDELDDKSGLSPKELMDVTSIIHSRKTPTFWEMGWQEIIFYCKLCSCFGIDYHCLEAASVDDVCLMNMGRNG
ncbi:hypothetical protein HanHA300_Chr04g0152281 [Helianthus annuus]|nr:hypothetical protein HanHA300_Chr04g0152281 [Helianthus annuus]KAJ0590685.1 hypothetical protein HanIR_Chr04g0200221 [Helianthus annuus]KAJ0762682.1 hypothetical protein HanOQP8_Chr04g0164041 [Helianthus annuus]KAJ0932944.1 hypothetical protein HanPSC8_Chr04g0179471 [Helianthus annuus]